VTKLKCDFVQSVLFFTLSYALFNLNVAVHRPIKNGISVNYVYILGFSSIDFLCASIQISVSHSNYWQQIKSLLSLFTNVIVTLLTAHSLRPSDLELNVQGTQKKLRI
jgi:hypothetical protein